MFLSTLGAGILWYVYMHLWRFTMDEMITFLTGFCQCAGCTRCYVCLGPVLHAVLETLSASKCVPGTARTTASLFHGGTRLPPNERGNKGLICLYSWLFDSLSKNVKVGWSSVFLHTIPLSQHYLLSYTVKHWTKDVWCCP